MEKKVIRFYRGLPGSGKTFHAENWAKENPNVTIVCKDNIRRDYFGVIVGDEKTRVKEKKVVAKRDELIMEALKKGKDIAVCDTNLNPLHEKNVKALVFPKYRDSYDFEIVDFTDVPVETCIERVSNRPEGVAFWTGVINKMKNEFIVPVKVYEDPNYYMGENKCILVDMDGTAAIHYKRSPFDFEQCHTDLPNYPVLDIVKMYQEREDVSVIILSGRPDTVREKTANWLASHGIKFDHLFMRKEGDWRSDVIVKEEIYLAEIKDKYTVYAVLDDRKKVVEGVWVKHGLPVFAFGNPYHDF
jgi:predicted kinase